MWWGRRDPSSRAQRGTLPAERRPPRLPPGPGEKVPRCARDDGGHRDDGGYRDDGRYLMPSILALDQGTTGSTALLIHQDGSVLGRGYREFTQHYPRPGWVEHDAEEILRVSIEA